MNLAAPHPDVARAQYTVCAAVDLPEAGAEYVVVYQGHMAQVRCVLNHAGDLMVQHPGTGFRESVSTLPGAIWYRLETGSDDAGTASATGEATTMASEAAQAARRLAATPHGLRVLEAVSTVLEARASRALDSLTALLPLETKAAVDTLLAHAGRQGLARTALRAISRATGQPGPQAPPRVAKTPPAGPVRSWPLKSEALDDTAALVKDAESLLHALERLETAPDRARRPGGGFWSEDLTDEAPGWWDRRRFMDAIGWLDRAGLITSRIPDNPDEDVNYFSIQPKEAKAS